MINQKLAWSTFAGGLSTFLMSLAEFLANHNTWNEMTAPKEVAHILVMSASLIMTVIGALAANLPREKNTRVDDSDSNQGSVNLNKVEKESLNENQ